jgi:coatomer subunit gamma
MIMVVITIVIVRFQLVPAVQLSSADYVKGVPVANFKAAWDGMDEASEVSGTYQLGGSSGVPAAVEAMIASLGMSVAEGTDVVAPNARSHMVMLSGELCGGHRALARIQFGANPAGSVAIKATTRADDEDVSQVVQDIIANED